MNTEPGWMALCALCAGLGACVGALLMRLSCQWMLQAADRMLRNAEALTKDAGHARALAATRLLDLQAVVDELHTVREAHAAQRVAASRATTHDLVQTGDADAHAAICDANGEVVLAYCRRCGGGEADLDTACAERLAARVRALEDRGDRVQLVALLLEASHEIEATVRETYGWPQVPPYQLRRFTRDMSLVTQLRTQAGVLSEEISSCTT